VYILQKFVKKISVFTVFGKESADRNENCATNVIGNLSLELYMKSGYLPAFIHFKEGTHIFPF